MKSFLFAFLSMLLVASAAVAQSGYQIRPGDTLQVEVLEDPSLNRSVLVLPDGTVSFPFAGSVRAGGLTANEVGSAITSGISSNFASPPNVFVTVQQLSERALGGSGGGHIHVFVMGEISSPGELNLRRGTTLFQALSQAGSFTPYAATKRIVVRRTDRRTGKSQVFKVNFRAIANGESVGGDIRLRDGDVIIVPQRRLFE